jgi:DNA mismatch repair protein MutS
MTRLALEYKEAVNVHLDAVEHKDTIVFMHAVEEGPASQSYGLQVAQLAGVPKGVIRNARRYLQMLEDASLTQSGQHDLFASGPAQAGTQAEPPKEPDALREALEATHPDELTPREALELLYKLKRL